MSAAGEKNGFRALQRGFYVTKMSAAGENFAVSERATRGILRYQMSAAGENFVVSEGY